MAKISYLFPDWYKINVLLGNIIFVVREGALRSIFTAKQFFCFLGSSCNLCIIFKLFLTVEHMICTFQDLQYPDRINIFTRFTKDATDRHRI